MNSKSAGQKLKNADSSVPRDSQKPKTRKKAGNTGTKEKAVSVYTNLFRFYPDAFLLLDAEGNILDLNDAAFTLLHYPRRVVMNRSMVKLIAKEYRPHAEINLQEFIHMNPVRFESKVMAGSGLILSVEITMIPVEKQKIGIAVIRENWEFMTNTKKMLGEIKHDAQLQKSQKLESLYLLAGGIAHDFNNLLGGIFGYVELARERIDPLSEASKYLTKAYSIFHRTKSLTQQLLTFTRDSMPVKRPILLTRLLKNNARFALSGSNLVPEFDIPENLWPCDADENQLGQVFDNILINARQAMPAGGVVRIAAENIGMETHCPQPLKPGYFVRVAIKDSGAGITPENLSRIFDPYFTTKQKASGLGLAIAYAIMSKHNGTIHVESETGKGATFFVYLPATPLSQAQNLMEAPPAEKNQGRILVLDDEDYIRQITRMMLESLGYTVHLCSQGAQAVDAFKRAFHSPHPFDGVILDLTIPAGFGAKEIIQELVKIDPDVIAIVSSGYSDDPVVTDPQAFGFKEKIIKPYRKVDLSNVLTPLLIQKKMIPLGN